jgi:hypothetical protein
MTNQIALTLPGYPSTFPQPNGLPNSLSKNSGASGAGIISLGLTLLLLMAIFYALFRIMVGSIRIVISRGNKEKFENARKTVIYAVIGLCVAFSSFFIINLLGNFVGINLLNTIPK